MQMIEHYVPRNPLPKEVMAQTRRNSILSPRDAMSPRGDTNSVHNSMDYGIGVKSTEYSEITYK